MAGESFSECQAIAGFTDCKNETLSSFTVGPIPGYFGIISDIFSATSSTLIICIFIAWSDIRQKGAQCIVTFIAISDLFTSLAYMTGALNMIITSHFGGSCNTFQTVCEIESYIVTCSIMSSYFWTIILAFYLYLTIASKHQQLASKLMPLYHVIAWGFPITVALPLLIVDKLSYAPFVSSIWCRMEVDSSSPPFSNENTTLAVFVTLPEIITYIVIIVLYVITRRSIKKEASVSFVITHIQRKEVVKNKMDGVHRVLSLVPVTFIFLRIWSTIQYYFTLYLAHVAVHNGGHCIPNSLKTVHISLAVFQAIFGGGQGWANGILYIILSPTIRGRLINAVCLPCYQKCCSKRLRAENINALLVETTTTTAFTPSKEATLSTSTRLINNYYN